MLHQETKRKIDNARNILVGKVPDPKSQIEQITIALMYKFMDDMDKQSEEWGGKASFFTGAYKKYSWSKIFNPKLGGFELMELYGDAITRMEQNPNIPQLFRDIFKNAYLPYRNPQTLKSFLKQIDEFSYDHSERLGDAFEYLLSIMSAQGDAGQFRTPRHIIDFIVLVVDPQKNNTIADPACGTAGFLISAYKHIMKANSENTNGDKLTPAEKKRLLNTITGYDISPDMVRLSLVNMYLHGFSGPKIDEYDTLTSEDRWDETFDVMLANPPFMSPKGGIRPHNRFSIKAKRSEVLFVDYIAEHLNPNGRAGIIVPEGIIFQSQKAYKDLRKMLVENYLYAVVSLPAGVFNPYSGVKTSMLLMDKSLAKKTNKILFVKIENDGFDLGAQRTPIEGSELPRAEEFIRKYKKSILNGSKIKNTDNAHIVEKSRIAESGDWNLSGQRYIDTFSGRTGKYEKVILKELCDIENGLAFKSKDYVEISNTLNFRMSNIRPNGIADIEYNRKYLPDEYAITYSKYLLKDGDVVIAMTDMASEPKILGVPTIIRKDSRNLLLNQRVGKFDKIKTDRLYKPFLKHILTNQSVKEYYKTLGSGGLQINIGKKDILRIKIPLPPLEVQNEIVAEIEDYQKIIDGACQVVENYKPTIKIDPDWEMVELGKIVSVNSGVIDPNKVFGKNEFIYIDISSIENGTGIVSFDNKIKGTDAPSRARRIVKNGDILLSTVRPNLKALAYLSNVPKGVIASTGFAVLSATKKVIPQFIYYQLVMEHLQSQMVNRMGKGAYPSINQKDVQELKILLPPIPIQKAIVAQIEEEQEIVNSNKKLISIFGQKIKDKIAEVWGDKRK